MHLHNSDPFPSPQELLVFGDFTLRTIFGLSQSDTRVITAVANDMAEGFVGRPTHIFGWIVYETPGPNPVRRTTYFGRRMTDNDAFVPVEASDWNLIQ